MQMLLNAIFYREPFDYKIIAYKGLGHATYEEAKDFNKRILNFLIQ